MNGDFSKLGFMVIDDDTTILRLVEAFLTTAKAGRIVAVEDAATAGAFLSSNRAAIHCVICDFSMAPLSGLEMLRLIRAGRIDNVDKTLCFIMLTASGQSEVVKAALELDANGYVRKPFDQVGLLKAINRSLTRLIRPKAPAEYDMVKLPRVAA